MTDRILDAFLERQHDEAMALAGASDLLDLTVVGSDRTRYLACIHARGLVRDGLSEPVEGSEFLVGIRFDRNYLRAADPARVLTWLAPRTIFHPNVRPPFICVGPIAAGTRLVELLYRVFDVITFNKLTPNEKDALNALACVWARDHRERFPIDRRPLKWRAP